MMFTRTPRFSEAQQTALLKSAILIEAARLLAVEEARAYLLGSPGATDRFHDAIVRLREIDLRARADEKAMREYPTGDAA